MQPYRPSLRGVTPWLVALCAGLAGQRSDAAGFGIGLGIDKPILSRSVAVVVVDYVSADPRFPWDIEGGRFGRHGHAGDFDAAPATYFASVQRRIQWEHLFVAGGIAWDSANNDILSGHWQFATGIGARFNRWTFSLRHLSNGGVTGHNHGETYALVELAF